MQFAWPDKFSVVDVSLTFSSAYGLLASCQELWEETTLSILLHYNVSYVLKGGHMTPLSEYAKTLSGAS